MCTALDVFAFGRNSAGETALHLAATQCSLRGLYLLLANGASINASDHRGRTPLHAACATYHGNNSTGESHPALECIELLLSSGALEDARDSKGQTALHLAVLAGNLTAAQALLAAGATPAADDAGNSPLHLAAARGHSNLIQLLVSRSRETSSRRPPNSSDEASRTLRRDAAAVIGGFRPASDVGLPADGKGQGHVSNRQGESSSTATDGEAFGDDGSAFRAAGTSQAHRFELSARDKHLDVLGDKPEEVSFRRGSHSRNDGREPSVFTDGSPPCRENGHSGSETSSLKLVPNDQENVLLRREGIHGNFQQWQEKTDAYNRLSEKPTRDASRTGEDSNDGRGNGGHRRLNPEHRRRFEGKGKKYGSRQSWRRHARDRDDRTLYWPEALPAHEYAQVNATEIKS